VGKEAAMNTSHTTEESIKSVAETLLDHARSVYRYTASYCQDNDGNARFDSKTRSFFRHNANRLIENLYAMLLISRRNSVGDFCNLEQVEAYYESAREVLGVREQVVDYAALFN
jgi:hypothetical protein